MTTVTLWCGCRPSRGSGNAKSDCKSDVRECNLALGSHEDNMRDRTRNGGDTVGMKNAQAKLDDDSVREIRRRYRSGESLSRLAKEFRVSKNTVAGVVNGKTWRHVADE